MKKIMTMLVTAGVAGAAMMGLVGNALAETAPTELPTIKCPAGDIADDCRGPKVCLYADPEDSTGFIQCNDAGMAYKLPCPAGLEWNDIGKICDYPHLVAVAGNIEEYSKLA